MDPQSEPRRKSDNIDIALRVGLYAFLCLTAMLIFSNLLAATGVYFAAAALGTFAGAITGNALLLRIFERLRLPQLGLYWNNSSAWNLALGVAGGCAAACLVCGIPLLTGAAVLRHSPDNPSNWGQFLFVSTILLFGAFGEELLFRGYAFQILVARMGPFATILPTAVLFALAHSNNLNSSLLGLVNTFAWGVLLGFSFLKSGDLWLPTGLHYGWNLTLPMFGATLSGFKMGTTGYALEWRAGPLWSGGEYGPEAGLPTLLVVVALFFYLGKAPIRPQDPPLLSRDREA